MKINDSNTPNSKNRTTFMTRIGASAVAVVTGATVALTGATPAHAVIDPQAVIEAVVGAYKTYQELTADSLTLEQATSRIISAINAAKTEIMAHNDRLAAAEVRACADSAIINIVDLQALTIDSRQIFAQNATECVTKANALLSVVAAPAQIDELGFALNAVGPIALVARASANLSTGALQQALINANNTTISRLIPTTSCRATILNGDSPPSWPKEVDLSCTAYNGEVGSDTIVCRCLPGRPRPEFDYTRARAKAMRSTSFAVANAVLPVLQA